MKIVFMGTPLFAVESLDRLHKNKDITVCAVITATDKPAGRGKNIQKSAVKIYAENHQIDVLQPSNLKDDNFQDTLAAYKAELFVVVAFRMLPSSVWQMPPKGTINLHASLLPQYRGAAPINWAVINGENKSGATTFFIEEKIDTGNIIDNVEVGINDDTTAGELHDELMVEGSKLLEKTVLDIMSDDYTAQPQPSYPSLKKAYKLNKDNCRINWDKSAEEIRNLIRGLNPYPSAWCLLTVDGKTANAKVHSSEVIENMSLKTPIETDYKDKLWITCGDNSVLGITEIQPAGKKRMSIKDFLNGVKNKSLLLH